MRKFIRNILLYFLNANESEVVQPARELDQLRKDNM
jgi:hypothetical protein